MTNVGSAAGGAADEAEPQAEELLRFAKQRKRDANARHRARKKAVQADPASWQQDIERQLEAERRRLAELQCDEAALNSMAAYQQEAMQVLEFANFADRMGGEVTFVGAAAAAAAAPAVEGGAAGDDTVAAAAAVDAAKDGKYFVVLFAANLEPVEKVEASVGSVGSVGERHAGTARAAQQAAAWQAAAAQPQAPAAWECVDVEEARAYVSSRSGSGGSSGSGGHTSGGHTSGGPAAGAAEVAAVPVSLPAQSTARGGAAGHTALHAAAPAVSTGAQPSAGAAPAADSAAARSGGARGSVHARSSGQQAPADASEFLDRMNLGAADRGLMDQLMQEQRVIKHWYFAGSATVRASIVRLASMALSVLPVRVISQRNKAYMTQLQHTLQRWEACPGSRRQIEEILAARFVDRQSLMRHLAHNRPKALLEVWAGVTCPPAPPGTPSIGGRPPLPPLLLPIAQYLEAILTPDKLAQLEVDWHKYQQAMGAAVEMRVQASARLQYAAAVQAISWQKQSMLPKGGSSAERSQAYCTMAESTGCLATLETRELIALLDLQEALMRVLTPIQMARVFMGCYPYNPDMTRICPWLFTRPAATQRQLPPDCLADGHFIAPMPAQYQAQPSFAMLGQQCGAAMPPQGVPPQAVPAGSHVPAGSQGWAGSQILGAVPYGAADLSGSAGLSGAAGMSGAAGADLAAAGPSSGAPEPDALLELLNDDELDLLIADLGGEDVGHLLAATSPRLP